MANTVSTLTEVFGDVRVCLMNIYDAEQRAGRNVEIYCRKSLEGFYVFEAFLTMKLNHGTSHPDCLTAWITRVAIQGFAGETMDRRQEDIASSSLP